MAAGRGVSFQDVVKTLDRISSYIHRTPVFTSSQADARSGRQLFFKCENFQKSGSFKARGAVNAILRLKQEDTELKGVVTHSSGNHGQALAWAARQAGVPCCVVVPQAASPVKKSAILSHGADLLDCGPDPADRAVFVKKVQDERGFTLIPPYDHLDVIAGQGTIVLEFLLQVPKLDAIMVPIGGGGLSSGICIAAKAIKPDIKIFLVCPKGKGMEETLRSGVRASSQRYLDTVADGIRMHQTGEMTTPILADLAEKMVFDMGEKEIIDGMKFAFERMKLVVEAASGAAVAAAFSPRLRQMDGMARVGVVLCGGNVDLDHLPF